MEEVSGNALKKVTVQVPAALLEEAQLMTGAGVTQTITEALEKLAASQAYRQMQALRGSCPDAVLDMAASREDRDG